MAVPAGSPASAGALRCRVAVNGSPGTLKKREKLSDSSGAERQTARILPDRAGQDRVVGSGARVGAAVGIGRWAGTGRTTRSSANLGQAGWEVPMYITRLWVG